MVNQIDLFDRQEERLAQQDNKIEPALKEWSYSRREVLEQCPRRYYYQYYGSNARMAKDESQKKTLRFLKTVSNRYLRTGEILHNLIRTYLRRKGILPLDRLLHLAEADFSRDKKYSILFPRVGVSPKSSYPPKLLLEFVFGFKNAEELWEKSKAQLLIALTNFVKSLKFAPFRNGGCGSGALIEKRIRMTEEHFSLTGKIDLAYPNKKHVVVVDWKIGGANGGQDSLQLLSYALEIAHEFKCGPREINLYQAHLVENKISQFKVSEKALLRARARIIQDLEKMRALDGYGRKGIAEAFTPCLQQRICILCPFQQICPKE